MVQGRGGRELVDQPVKSATGEESGQRETETERKQMIK